MSLYAFISSLFCVVFSFVCRCVMVSSFIGRCARVYLAAAFPVLFALVRAGLVSSSWCMAAFRFANQNVLIQMHLVNQKDFAYMQNETQKESAGMQQAKSYQNTKEQ